MDFNAESVTNMTCKCITEEVITEVIRNSIFCEDVTLKKYSIFNASDKMLGFLADYWKLQIQIINNTNETKIFHYFIKAISTSNAAKANMVKEMKLFDKERTFYTEIKKKLDKSGISPWSPKLILPLNDALIFEDLNYLQYKTRNKLETFDEEHILLALETLSRFHASTIIYEERKSEELGKSYRINDEHENDLNQGGYQESDPWFLQCINGSLEIIEKFSKFKNSKELHLIEKHWKSVWIKALRLANQSTKYRNVICHRDLWNNNILFNYKKFGLKSTPDNCLLVDFQAIRCQPPAGDIMLLLHCNLEREYRRNNTTKLLNYYYTELKNILKDNSISIEKTLPYQDFINSCDEQNLWGLVVSACLVPQFWIDDDLTIKIFSDTSNFDEILTKNKAKFIQNMMEINENYKKKVLKIFEEIAQEYCLDNSST